MEQETIRIAQIIGKWIGGGVESVVMNYYKNIDRNKVQFDFICDDDSINIPYEQIEKMGGKVILIPPYQNLIKYHKALKKVLKEGKYKIVHSHINTLSVFSLFAAKRAKVPVRIAHSHSTTNKKEKKKDFMKQILRPFSKLFATDYMCCSELAGRWLFGNEEYDRGKVFLLNNSIELDKFKYNEEIRQKIRNELEIKDNTLVVGHVGRFVEQKNHNFLIDVFYEIHKKYSNTILLMAGYGPLENEIRNKVHKLCLDDSVIFLGQVSNTNELYQAMDVFVLPSLYEGLPVVGIEAQASGLMCVFSNKITEETKVTQNAYFESLDLTAKIWADFTLDKTLKYKRTTSQDEIKNNGFDIKSEAIKLQEKYLEYVIDEEKKEKKYISFDIFDTLIKRLFPSIEFYKVVEKRAQKEGIYIKNFVSKRDEAEKKCMTEIKNYTLSDIYKKIDNVSENEIEILKGIEKRFTVANTIPNLKGKNIYLKYKKNKKICISDMYLDSKSVKKILKENGYEDFKKIYVSSEYGENTKKNKKLFDIVLKDLKIKNKEIIHYGDSIRSDYINPKIIGISSRLVYNRSCQEYGFFNFDSENYYYNLGFNLFGPIMYEFCKWIKENKNEKMFFLSREGIFIEKCYKELYSVDFPILYFSRKSVLKGIAYDILKDGDLHEILSIISLKKNETIRELFERFGLNINNYKDELENSKIDIDKKINEDIYEFFNIHKEKILIELYKYNMQFSNYIKNNLDFEEDNTFVDIGWNGSMQILLEKYICKKKYKGKLTGLYLGTTNSLNKKGFLFNEKNHDYENIMCFSGILEILMMPNVGSVIGYEDDGKPVFDKIEFSNESQKSIYNIQMGIIYFLKRMKEFEFIPEFSMDSLTRALIEFGCRPKSKDIKKLGRLEFYDNGKNYKLVEKVHLETFKDDFINSKWKTAYLKQILKINFNYNKIINYLRRKNDK